MSVLNIAAGSVIAILLIADISVQRSQSRFKAMNDDEMRLAYIHHFIDGLGGIDLHERASQYAAKWGRDEPIANDYCNAARDAIDACIAAARLVLRGKCECGASYYRAEDIGKPCEIQYCRGIIKATA
jgi:hypothetical protein